MATRLLLGGTIPAIAVVMGWGLVAAGIGPRFGPPLAFFTAIVAASVIGLTGLWTLPLVSRSRATRIVIVSLVVVLSLPGLLASAVVSCQFANNLRLNRFANQIRALLPTDAVIEKADLRVSVITGNGDHCDFQAYFLVSGLTKTQLLQQLEGGSPLKPAMPGGTGQLLSLEVLEVPGAPGRLRIGTIDSPYPAGLDLRCT